MTAKTLTLQLLRAVGLTVVFTIATGFALVLHLDLPAGRRALAGILESTLDRTFTGKFWIGTIERVDVSGVVARDVVVADPSGRRVLSVDRLRAQSDLPQLIGTLLFGGNDVTLVVDHVHVDRASARLVDDASTGAPSLLSAFTPRPSDKPSTNRDAARIVRVLVRDIELTRGFIRGRTLGSPTLEVEVHGVRGAVRSTPEGTHLVVRRFGTLARGLRGADLRGVASMRLRVPGWLWTSFDGHFGEVQLGAMVRLDGEQLMATLDVPRAKPAEVRALLPEYPLHEDASVQLEASGTTDRLALHGRVDAGDGRLRVSGPIRLSRGLAADVELEGQNVDLRVALPDAPATRLDLRARLGIEAGSGPVALNLVAATEPTTIEGLALPAAEVAGALTAGRLEGTALLREPGAPTRVQFRLDPDGLIQLRAEASAVRLERAPRIAKLLPARGVADVRVDIRIAEGKLQAQTTANVRDLRYGALAMSRGTISGRVQGDTADLGAIRVDASVAGSGVRAGELVFDRLAAKASGPARAPQVHIALERHDGPRIEAQARVAPSSRMTRIDELALAIRQGAGELRGSAQRIEIADDRLDVRGLDVSGLGGTLRGSARVTPDRFEIQAQGRSLNLASLSRLVGFGTRPRGTVDVDADVVIAPDVERATARIAVANAAVGILDDLSATMDASLERGALRATLHTSVAQVGTAEAKLDANLGGSALDFSSYRDMTGQLDVSIIQMDLGLLGTVLAAQGTVEGLQGKLHVNSRFTRQNPRALPTLSVTGHTEGVQIALPKDAATPRAPATIIQGLDLKFGTNVDGETGATDVSVQLVDQGGALALATVSATVDLTRARRAPAQWMDQLLATPVTGRLLAGERSLTDLPPWMQPPNVRGRVRLEAALGGTLREPELTARFSLSAFGLENARNQRPIDLCASLAYEPKDARVLSSGEAFLNTPQGARCTGQRVLRYSVDGTIGLDGRGGIHPRGTATLGIEGFPLDAVPGLGDAGVSGRSLGSLSLTNTDGAPRLAAALDLRDVRVQGVAAGSGKLRVQSDQRSIGGTLVLTQTAGELKMTALAAVRRGDVLPEIDAEQPIFVRATANGMDAIVLSPLLKDVLSEIRGRVDADLAATLIQQDPKNAASPLEGSVQGNIALTSANIQLAGLGLRLSDVTLKARADADGNRTRITVQELGGRGGRSGERVNVRDAELLLERLRPTHAQGLIETTELPLMLEGVAQATATTRQGIAFRFDRRPERLDVVFEVPYLVVALPQSTGRAVISLAENDAIEVLQPLGEPIRRSGEGAPWWLRFELGQNVRLTRADLDIPLTGAAEILLADDVTITGELALTSGGQLRVADNVFVIESGVVRFDTGDPSDPSILVMANWRAPDDTIVVATASGTLQEPQVRLSSSPSKPEAELWALVLGYGAPGESSGGPGAASALVGAQQLLAPLLQNTPVRNVSISAGVDERGDRSYTTYTAAVPISESIWFEGSYHAPNPTEEREYNSGVSGTIDWRFRPRWSLRTEVGTIGTALDLIWQYRY